MCNISSPVNVSPLWRRHYVVTNNKRLKQVIFMVFVKNQIATLKKIAGDAKVSKKQVSWHHSYMTCSHGTILEPLKFICCLCNTALPISTQKAKIKTVKSVCFVVILNVPRRKWKLMKETACLKFSNEKLFQQRYLFLRLTPMTQSEFTKNSAIIQIFLCMLNIRFFIVLAHVRGVTTNALRSCVIKVWQSILSEVLSNAWELLPLQI